MGYQSKTWSLSDDVVEEIGRRVTAMIETTGAGSPNRVLKELLFPPSTPFVPEVTEFGPPTSGPPARELLVELDGEGDG